MLSINSTAKAPQTWKVMKKMANPITDPTTATVETNEAND